MKKKNTNWTSYDDMMLHELEAFIKDMTDRGPDGLVRLGEFFAEAEDYENAIKMMERAAGLGSHYAYFWLGWIYSLPGIGYYDKEASFKWLYAGARTGSVYCMYLLGLWLHGGVGCIPDETKSTEWLAKAFQHDPDGHKFEEMKSFFEEGPEAEPYSIIN